MGRIAAKYIYTLEDFSPIEEGYVEYDENGTVTDVGKCVDFSSEANVFDGAVVPGFVNAHCHVELSHLEGMFCRGSGMAGFIDQINSLRDCVSSDEKKVLLSRQMDKMWSEGVSAMADISNGSDSFEAKRDSLIYTRTFIEVFGTEPEDCGAVIAGAKELEVLAAEYGIDASITPHSCYTTCPQLLTAASAEALRTGFLSYHSQESQQEEDMIRYGSGELYDNRIRLGMSVPPPTGTSSLEYFLTRLGLSNPQPLTSSMTSHDDPQSFRADLSAVATSARNAHILLVHNVCLTREAAEKALAELENVWWAICPLSNIFIHNALPPVRMMRELGLSICVGTDSLSSNDILDIVAELFCLQESFPEIPLGELLTWASLNGARFLAKDDILGTISVGKRPGLVGISSLSTSPVALASVHCGSDAAIAPSDAPASAPAVRLTSASRSIRLV